LGSVVFVVGLTIWRMGGGAVNVRGESESLGGNQVVMTDVRIEAFDERFNRTTILRGKTATTFKNSSNVVLEPCNGSILREQGKDVQVIAARAHKIVSRSGEKIEFTGKVEVSSEGRELRSEKLVYTPVSRLLESGAPVQILTTGTSITSKSLKGQTDIKTGVLEGDVQITSMGQAAKRYDAPIRITGQRSDFDLAKQVYEVSGSAWAKKLGQDIQATKITYNRSRRTLTADGNTVARRPNLVVHAGHLEYWIDQELGIATKNPKAVQKTPATTNETESRTELAAQLIDLHFGREILEAKDDVCMQRFVKFDGDWEPDYKITSRTVTSLFGKRRSTFRGDVKIETDKLGALGDRAIFYQDKAKLYVIGRAQAWDYDEDRKRQNEIAGEQIVHNLRNGQSQVLDRVRSRFKEGGPARSRSERTAPRGRVEMIFREGEGQ